MFGSVQPQPIKNQPDGTLALDDIKSVIKPDDCHFAISRLVCLESPIGGVVLSNEYIRGATKLARDHGLKSHLDGARLFNGAAANVAASKSSENQHTISKEEIYAEARAIASNFDSVSICFSKGLGTPMGKPLSLTSDLSILMFFKYPVLLYFSF